MPLLTPVLIPQPLGSSMNGVFRRTHFVAGSCINEWTSDVGTRTVFRNGTLTHFYLRVLSTTLTNTDTVNLRKGGSNGNLVVSVGAAATGVFEDLVHSDVFDATGASVAVSHSPTGGTNVVWDALGARFEGDGSDTIAKFGGGQGVNNLGSGSTLALADLFGVSGTEAHTQFRTATDATLRNATIDVSLNSRNGASTFNLRHNTADSAIVVSVAASTTGIVEDLVHSVAVVSGDYLGPFIATVGGTTGTIRSGTHSAELVTTDDTSMVWGVSSASLSSGLTRSIAMMGRANFSGTDNHWKCLCDTPASHLYVQTAGNVNGGSSTWRLRINGADATQVVSIPSSGSGYFEDDGNEDTLTVDDLVNYQVVTGSGSGSLQLRTVGMLLGPAEPGEGSPGPPEEVSQRNLLTGSAHTVDGGDNLIAGTAGTVEADLVALFSLDGDPHSETRDRTFCVHADNICLNGAVEINGNTVEAGAPLDASFVTLGTNPTLTNERVLTAGAGITLTDAGAGSTLTIAATSAGVTLVRKTADESVTTSAVLQNDDHLVVALAASSVYEIRYSFMYQAGTGGDFKWVWNGPTDIVATEVALRLSNSATTSEGNVRGSAGAFTAGVGGTLSAGGTGGNASVLGTILAVTTTAGNLQLTWAQETSNGTATILRAGSYLIATKL